MVALSIDTANGLRIGITQRHQPASEKTFARDALDAGWSDWVALRLPQASFMAIPNFANPDDAVTYLRRWAIDALFLSGGEDVGSSARRDAMEAALVEQARASMMPVVGVCRGMQLLHSLSGGALEMRPDHAGARHEIAIDGQTVIVNSWHRFVVTSAMPEWETLAAAADGSIEAMRHSSLPWLAMMWHPERSDGNPAAMDAWMAQVLSRR